MKYLTKNLFIIFLIMLVVTISSISSFAEENVKVLPYKAVAGTYQHIQFEFMSDSSDIEIGGSIRIEIPVAYLETKSYYWDQPQTEQSQGRGYVEATTSGDASIGIKIYGSHGRIVECIVQDSPLKKNKSIILDYYGTVQSFTWPIKICAQWKKSVNDKWHDIQNSPKIQILPQRAETMLLVSLSDVQVDKPFEMAVVLLDKFGNKATGYRGIINFSSSDSSFIAPNSYTFTEQDSGAHIFNNIRFKKLGFQLINATDGILKAQNNYSYVTETPPEFNRYFGDTHFHTGSGTDNQKFTMRGGGGDHRGHFTKDIEAYRYIRDVMQLDFASVSEHDNALLTEEVWNKSQETSESFNSPGKFTTFFAYEWTSPSTSGEGHHVILYKNKGKKIFGFSNYPKKQELWDALDKQTSHAIVIPHCMWTQTDHGIWDRINNNYRVIGEIYSLWNTRFLLPPGDDVQRFELGPNDKWSYQYAWANGHKIGVIGSSDNHTGYPGLNNFTSSTVHTGGLAVALAQENNRENIWDAFQNRRTYATTGTRIYLDFTCDGYQMGSEYTTDQSPSISVKVAGTNSIEIVEVVKFSGQEYKTIFSDKPEDRISILKFKDEKFSQDSMYYVRVKQVDEVWRSNWAYGNAEIAWSSPIWVNYDK
jgi:uncharacterized protein DUF3604